MGVAGHFRRVEPGVRTSAEDGVAEFGGLFREHEIELEDTGVELDEAVEVGGHDRHVVDAGEQRHRGSPFSMGQVPGRRVRAAAPSNRRSRANATVSAASTPSISQ